MAASSGLWTSLPSAVSSRAAVDLQAGDGGQGIGDLAIVLHSHMPYVEGFGTYPFGEEWLFDAVARSHLPVLQVARAATVSVTPVLADQLELRSLGGRLEDFLRRYRLAPIKREASEADPGLRAAALSQAEGFSRSLDRVRELDLDVLGAFAEAQRDGRVELIGSAATHAVLPMIATRAGVRLQLDVGLSAHRHRFGPSPGFWLPECAYRPGLDSALAERGVRWTCVDQSAFEDDLDPLTPVQTPAGPLAFTIDWPTVELVWSSSGFPADPAYLDNHRRSVNGTRLWRIGGGAYDPELGRARAGEHAEEFLSSVTARLRRFAEPGRRGLCVFAIDTELLGEWWAEGPIWLEAVCRGAPAHGVELVTLSEAARRHRPQDRPLRTASWGEDKDLSTWDGADVSDLAIAARRLELRLLRVAASGLRGPRLERAARELLAVQSSDWAFMASRHRAGDYAYGRAVSHAEELLSALEPSSEPNPRLRNLAPHLDPWPLLAP